MEETKVVEKDPFLDDEFAPLDTRDNKTFVEQLEALEQEQTPEPEPEPEPTPKAEPKAAEPEVIQWDGVGVLTVEHTKKGWKGSLDAQDGQPLQVYYGPTKEAMYQNIAVGKIHADKKIREQNRQIKLGPASEPVKKAAPAEVAAHELTPDEVFEIKTQLMSDPDLALKSWFQKSTGMSLNELMGLVQDGRQAKADLDAESVARAFLAANPEYYPDPRNENTAAIVAYLFKHKMRENLPEDMPGTHAIGKLHSAGFWSVKDITEAYLELDEAGLLVRAPQAASVEPEPVVEPEPEPVPAATPTPKDGRIVRRVERPRASLGLRQRDVSASQTVAPAKEPSVEEFDSMSDEDVAKTFAAIRQHKAQTRR